MSVKQVSGKQILSLLQEGHPRYKKNVVEGGKTSVEEELDLTASQLKEYLKHPKLANFRYTAPAAVLVDDFETVEMVDDFEDSPLPAQTTTQDIPVEEAAEALIDVVDAEEDAVFA